jgi:putative hydrolase of the HAD superfamily
MKTKPKFIYFDLDDTLLDHKSAEKKALGDIHEHFDCFNGSTSEELFEVYRKINSKQWKLYSEGKVDREQLQRNRFQLTLNELGIGGNNYSEIGSQYMKFYRNHWEWITGAEAAFQSIRSKFNTGILTNGFSETQKAKFERFDLYSKVSHLVISEDVGHLKPHPKIFEHATDVTGLSPGEILYIGDSYNSDVIGGTSFGWNVAWFTTNGTAEENQKADFVFDDFKDLSILLGV